MHRQSMFTGSERELTLHVSVTSLRRTQQVVVITSLILKYLRLFFFDEFLPHGDATVSRLSVCLSVRDV